MAAIVVSEINDRLSPNIAPPITAPAQSGTEIPPFCATVRAIGDRTLIVPTLVPMAMEIRQAMRNSPGTEKLAGMTLSIMFATLTAPPVADASPLKAPASRKIRSMIVILLSPIPRAQTAIFSSKERRRFCMNATVSAIPNETTTDVM